MTPDQSGPELKGWPGHMEDDMAGTSLTDRGYTYEDLKMALTHIRKLEAKIRDLESRLEEAGNLRPSLEVLQRMANGLDPFDRGRFQCAVAALPHETPKLTATVSHSTNKIHWGPIDPLDPDRIARGHEKTQKHLQERLEASGLQVIEGEGREA